MYTRLSPAPPPVLQQASDALTAIGDSADTILTVADGAISAAEILLFTSLDPIAAAAQIAVDTAKSAVNDFFGLGGYSLILHPYIQGVGTISKIVGFEDSRSLTFPDALKYTAKKLLDPNDPRRPNYTGSIPMESVLLIIGAPSPVLFASALGAFSKLIALPDLERVQRKIEKLLEEKEERFKKPKPPKNPAWKSFQARDIPAFGNIEKSLNGYIGMAEGYAKASETALAETKKLIEKKKKILSDLSAQTALAFDLSVQGLDNIGLWGQFFAASSTDTLAAAIKASAKDAPGNELSFCACVCLVAPANGLKIVKETLNI